MEELGISTELERLLKLPASDRTGQEFIWLYRGQHGGPFQIARSEIEYGAFFPPDVVEEWIAESPTRFRTRLSRMLERISTISAHETRARRLRFAQRLDFDCRRRWPFRETALALRRAERRGARARQVPERRTFEFPRRSPRRFLAAVN